jgi:branched-chain amino acid transport system substrate-binding protein
MKITKRPGGMDRRDFLKALGLFAGGAVASGAAPVSVPIALRRAPVRIGVLAPRSHLFPELGNHFAQGLRLGMSASGAEFVVEDAGATPGRAEEKARQLVENDRPDVLVAAVNDEMEESLGAIAREAGIPLAICSMGARMRRTRRGDEAFHNSLNHWQACRTLGEWSARELGGTAMIAMSMLESGYDAHAAFQLGFEGAGGRILDARVTDAPQASGGADAFAQEARDRKPDVVFGCYGGLQGLPFLRAFRSAGLGGRTALVGSSLLADDRLLSMAGADAVGIRSCAAWAPDLPHAGNRAFLAAWREKRREAPDVFAMHGYETGLLLTSALESGGARGLRAALARADFESPRGRWRWNAAAGFPDTPLYLCEIGRCGGGVANRAVAELPHAGESEAALAALPDGLRSGWTNTYLCT